MADIVADPVVQHLTDWGKRQPSIRAVILTSSRCAPGGEIDGFSDYDVILGVTDVTTFYRDRSWLGEFGTVLVLYRDPLKSFYGFEKFASITQYDSGLKIDFNVWPTDLLNHLASLPTLPDQLDIGYMVLVDKDGLTKGLKPPGFRAYIPEPPELDGYLAMIEEFFQDATYVAKYLWRDDLVVAKDMLDHNMKLRRLHTMLVWRFEMDHNWSVRPGDHGRGIKRRISPAHWTRLEETYVGGQLEENWSALFKTIALFRDVAIEVGERLGYTYPDEMDLSCVAYLQRVQSLDRPVQ